MLWLDETNAEEYLRSCCAVEPEAGVRVEALAGGVSNQVLFVAVQHAAQPGRSRDFVLKQAREQLRTPQPWFSSIERIWREVEVLRVCQEVLSKRGQEPFSSQQGGQAHLAPKASHSEPVRRRIQTPQILFEDRTCYAFAMSAAPREHVVWKTRLLAGEADAAIAAECGTLLATLHGETWNSPDVARRLGERQLFDELRLDPYYRTVAALDEEAAALMQDLITSVQEHPCSLVHADFSPKNLLVYPRGLMMVDFETGHYGDPAFDLGFFLSHLMLKAVYHAPACEPFLALTERFWDSYAARIGTCIAPAEFAALVARGIRNFAGCAWARIDGKSRVEYLVDPKQQNFVRSFCRQLLRTAPAEWPAVLQQFRQAMATHTATPEANERTTP